jgi:hypothetical protein
MNAVGSGATVARFVAAGVRGLPRSDGVAPSSDGSWSRRRDAGGDWRIGS